MILPVPCVSPNNLCVFSMRSLVGVEQPLQLCVVSVYKSTGYTTDQIVCAFYLVMYLVKIACCMGFFVGF